MPALTDVSCVLSLVFCGIIINQLLSKVNNIRFFYLTMVFTVLHETFLIETIPNLEEFGFIHDYIQQFKKTWIKLEISFVELVVFCENQAVGQFENNKIVANTQDAKCTKNI
ncbi:unnamed protein product [Tenebrio molitor]|nr:unnamed protein product [Tenebrio molitor]